MGMVGAMLVLLLLIGTFVFGRSLLRDQPEVRPTEVDYLAAVEGAQANNIEVYYPAQLPKSWVVTSVELPAVAGQPWALGMLTADGTFVGLRQESRETLALAQQQLGPETSLGDEIELPQAEIGSWRSVAGPTNVEGDLGIITDVGGGSLLLYGSANADALASVAATITSAPLAGAPPG